MTRIISDREIAGHAKAAGFTGEDLWVATAIALGESGGDAGALCHDCFPGIAEYSVGLWQINLNAHTQYQESDMLDPAKNARAAYAVSGNGGSFNPWSVFKNGSYLSFEDRAKAAAGDPSTANPAWKIIVDKLWEFFKDGPLAATDDNLRAELDYLKALDTSKLDDTQKGLIQKLIEETESSLDDAFPPPSGDWLIAIQDVYESVYGDFTVPNPIEGWVGDLTDIVGTVGVNILAVASGLLLVALGLWGLLGAAPGGKTLQGAIPANKLARMKGK